ncbi:MAG: pentapeptide repeat-containing protein [Symploca sp. SIO2G7]|nr:pentapeptide repeat-containing protein [Symploca sp. SIO2G7]
MAQKITQWLRYRGKSSVALVAVTACIYALAQGPAAQAVDDEDLIRLIRTRNCPGCDLREADLRRLDLTGANLEGANLREANLFYTILDGANLSRTDLRLTNLTHVRALTLISETIDENGQNLTVPAQFIGADLAGALLDYANFSGALMEQANFQDAYIHKTRFVNTDLSFSNFEATFVHDVDLRGADLCGSTYWGGNDYRRECTVPITDLEE